MSNEISLTLPELHTGQERVKREARRFNVVRCGRRWGKTLLGEDVIIEPALNGYPVGWFSPTYKMLADIWRELSDALSPVTQRVNTQEHRLELISGGVLDMWSLDSPDGPRGRKYKCVVIDESAIVPNLDHIWHAIIRPTLADYAGDSWFLSTPKGYNFFRTAWMWGQDETQPEWNSWHMTTYDNPYIRREEIDAMRSGMPERTFRQEVLAEFVEDGGGVFRRVKECATLQPLACGEPGHVYAGGIDWARSNDYTVLTLIDLRTKRQVAMDRFSQVNYELQLGRFAGLHERFRPITWLAEENAMGGPLVERLRSMGYPVQPFVTTAATKSEIIDGLALAFERGDIGILDNEVQTTELQAYEMTRLPSGTMRYSAPDGMHDDCVMALAIAWHAASQPPAALPLAGGQRPMVQNYRPR